MASWNLWLAGQIVASVLVDRMNRMNSDEWNRNALHDMQSTFYNLPSPTISYHLPISYHKQLVHQLYWCLSTSLSHTFSAHPNV